MGTMSTMARVLEGVASGLLTNLASNAMGSFNKKWCSAKEKKKNLEHGLDPIHAVVDATKGRVIRSRSLKRWLNKIEIASDLGDCALKMVNLQVIRENNSAKLAGSSVVSRVSDLAKKSFDGGVAKKLDAALEKIEAACRNLQSFLRLLELDASSKTSSFKKVKSGFSVRRFRVRSIQKRTKYKKQLVVLSRTSSNCTNCDELEEISNHKREKYDNESLYKVLNHFQNSEDGKIESEWGMLCSFFENKIEKSETQRENNRACFELKSWCELLANGSMGKTAQERWLILRQICIANPLLFSISQNSLLFGEQISSKRKREENFELQKKNDSDCNRKKKMKIVGENICNCCRGR